MLSFVLIDLPVVLSPAESVLHGKNDDTISDMFRSWAHTVSCTFPLQFSCALLLKLNLAGEFLGAKFYDVTMTASVGLCLVSEILVSIHEIGSFD